MRSITREQRMLAAAAANVLFIISLFFPWYGFGDLDFSGDDVIPAWWLMLIFAVVAALILAADAYNFELPAAISPGRHGGLPDQRHVHRHLHGVRGRRQAAAASSGCGSR